MSALARLEEAINYGLEEIGDLRVSGVVSEVAPSHYRISGLSHFLKLGECVGLQHDSQMQLGEVVRIDPTGSTVKSFDATVAAGIGDRAFRIGPLHLSPDESWKGRVIDALGRPIDGQGTLLRGEHARSIELPPPLALNRTRVKTPLRTGVRAIDLFMPLCAGQRIGVFAGSGVGKSTLLGMLAGAKGFSAVVVGLVGERGREVREFLDDLLGHNRRLAVTVVSTGDESPMMRRLAPKTAMTIAEYFRDRGENVLLIIDLVTRFAHAARDVALAAGEPAVARGYAPSVFSDLPKLLERAGPGAEGERLDHRRFLRPCRRRRPQRSGRRQYPRHARRPYRARPRHRRPRPLPGSQCALLDLASGAACLDEGAANAGAEAEIHDRPL